MCFGALVCSRCLHGPRPSLPGDVRLPLPSLAGDVRPPQPDPCPPLPERVWDTSVVQHLARTARSCSDVPRSAIGCLPAHSNVVCVVDFLHASCCLDSWARTLPYVWLTHPVVLRLVLLLGPGETFHPCSSPDYCGSRRFFKPKTIQNLSKINNIRKKH